MTPRPRKVSDDDVFAAVHGVMSRVGPGELTLQKVAAQAGVTAGALVQRFGSKRDLLLALAARSAGSTSTVFAGLRTTHASPLAAIAAYAECLATMAASPAALARSLAYLQVDLTDEAFRKHLLAQARATRKELERLLREAVTTGELAKGTDAAALARTVETVLGGSLITWALHRRGRAARWLRHDLDAVLGPHRSGRATDPP